MTANMNSWTNDSELFKMVEGELFSCVVGDILDQMGKAQQYLPPRVRPLCKGMTLVGRAMTVLEADCVGTRINHEDKERAFGVMFEALDSLQPGDIYLCSGSTEAYACWGELMSTRAAICGARGAVIDGYSRDTRGIEALNFPTFSYGPYGQDQGIRGRVIDFRCPLKLSNGVVVENGDLLIGDIDGVVAVPQAIESEVIHRALKKVRDENMVAIKIKEGMPTREVWDTYGVM
jgi:regulator of RNase E activity RraA